MPEDGIDNFPGENLGQDLFVNSSPLVSACQAR